MPDPMMLSTVAAAGLQGLQFVTGQVSSWRSGKAKGNDVHQLAVRYWGCVLFEVYANLRSIRDSLGEGETEDSWGTWPGLSFTFSTSLLPELAQLSPMPMAVAHLDAVVGWIRQIDILVALDRQAATTYVPGVPGLGGGFASQRANSRKTWMMNSQRVLPMLQKEFESLRAAVSEQGRKAFGDDEWNRIELETLPYDLSTSNAG